MNEAEWRECASPGRMLDLLDQQWGETLYSIGRRRLRLFACGCVRGIWALLRQPESSLAVETVERYVDGLAGDREMAAARAGAGAANTREAVTKTDSCYCDAAAAAAGVAAVRLKGAPPSVFHSEYTAARAWAKTQNYPGHYYSRVCDRLAVHANLLRDIFGNPFCPITIHPAWGTPDVLRMAQAAYEERQMPSGELDPVRLAILADALEDAGCADDEILSHLRSTGPHVRGCWPLDALLGRLLLGLHKGI